MEILIWFAFCIVLQINTATAAYWVHASNGDVPDGAILSGNDKGVNLYTCRAWYASNLIPGKLTTVNQACNIAYNGQEVKIADYDVAVGDGAFFKSAQVNYTLSNDSVEGGIVTSQEKFLYICRATIDQARRLSFLLSGAGYLIFSRGT